MIGVYHLISTKMYTVVLNLHGGEREKKVVNTRLRSSRITPSAMGGPRKRQPQFAKQLSKGNPSLIDIDNIQNVVVQIGTYSNKVIVATRLAEGQNLINLCLPNRQTVFA